MQRFHGLSLRVQTHKEQSRNCQRQTYLAFKIIDLNSTVLFSCVGLKWMGRDKGSRQTDKRDDNSTCMDLVTSC